MRWLSERLAHTLDSQAEPETIEERLLRQKRALEAFGDYAHELFMPDPPTARGTETDGMGR
jgi:hypothetical protein